MSVWTSPASSTPPGATSSRAWFVIALLVLVLGGAWLWWSRVLPEQLPVNRPAEPAVNHPAPDFTLTTLGGEQFTLSEQGGTPVVLNFWATWCGPCQRELPALQAAAERYAGRVHFVGVDQGESAETVQKYVDELGLTFTIPIDKEQLMAQRYNVMGLPTTFFIDGEGVIRHLWMGEMTSITLEEGIARIVP